ncbi:aldehyde dehydrogenase [Pseudomaricurvus alkylphenolicus]|uniref:aldehyde dehydrogenase n=1 Tax=Pseudomaricurvus alkylphenolicus TaxID=1306991 RepID=UPI00141F3BDE|nr:aldehyde dehydrogenase [Pseudomaricurvus alkylphenolicus]NIB38918.1 aldehyde dehydrogenase [Pseudomaricurvus alkylphenolicus]
MNISSYQHFYINNEWQAPSGHAEFSVINPATERIIATVPKGENADIDRAVAAAREAFDKGPWPRMSAAERAQCMKELSAALQADLPALAALITQEMGSPMSFSLPGQAYASTMVLDYYAQLAQSYPFEEQRAGLQKPLLVRGLPVGVVAAITPWNVPLFTLMLKLAPALAAGCTLVLKPSPETPLSTYALIEAVAKTSIPPGVINLVPADRDVGEYLVSHPGVDKVSFTGSTVAGRKIGGICGQQLKRCTLELGGKSAAIILDDANLDKVVPELLPAAIMNSGQACIAQTRILAPRQRYTEIVETFSAAFSSLKVGDPMQQDTHIGPLFSQHHRERVESYINLGQQEGASVVTGGGRPRHLERGWYIEPTLFADVDNNMRIAQEEIFGPVVVMIPYDSDADAARIANDSDYGLSGSVWGEDTERGLDIARQVRTGTYTVNGLSLDFNGPFGGFKQSGLGRELGPEGLQAYLETQCIALQS